jgi:hypothetical protein
MARTTHTPPQQSIRMAQAAAEAFWLAATSNDHSLAMWDSPAYKALQRAFVTTTREVYHLTAGTTAKVLCLLSEYGPHDSLSGTTGSGVFSYVQFARSHNRNQYHY